MSTISMPVVPHGICYIGPRHTVLHMPPAGETFTAIATAEEEVAMSAFPHQTCGMNLHYIPLLGVIRGSVDGN